MYAWIWRHLPGSWPVRLLLYLVFVAAVVAALFLVIFPWVTETFGIGSDVTVS